MGLMWRVAAVVALSHVAVACNVRELSEIIQNRFRKEALASCGIPGDKCAFDKDCCKGLECKMSASKIGIDNYCQRMERANDVKGDMGEGILDSEETPLANEPKSEEDVNWMIVKSQETGEDHGDGKGEEPKHTDTLGEIENLQEKKRLKLLEENEELEKLFTENDERELEQLRALKEDAEIDELRRLKERRLKRKLQLIKELRELRGLKAEEDLNRINEIKNATKSTKDKVFTTVPAVVEEETTAYVETSPKEEQPETQPEETPPEPQAVTEVEAPNGIDQTKEPEVTTVKHGIHRRRHRQGRHKRREAQATGRNSTSDTQDVDEVKGEEATLQENPGENSTVNAAT